MLRFLSAAVRKIFGAISMLFTGGKYGSAVPSDHHFEYSKSQERKRKDFSLFGGRPCKICGCRIPANKSYCGPCYFKYVKK